MLCILSGNVSSFNAGGGGPRLRVHHEEQHARLLLGSVLQLDEVRRPIGNLLKCSQKEKFHSLSMLINLAQFCIILHNFAQFCRTPQNRAPTYRIEKRNAKSVERRNGNVGPPSGRIARAAQKYFGCIWIGRLQSLFHILLGCGGGGGFARLPVVVVPVLRGRRRRLQALCTESSDIGGQHGEFAKSQAVHLTFGQRRAPGVQATVSTARKQLGRLQHFIYCCHKNENAIHG